MKNLLGIMQGRLVPKFNNNFQAHPFGYWEKEFFIASELGFDCIEFILDFYKANQNPLLSSEGIKNIKNISSKTKVKVNSICADYFMENPVFSEDLKEANSNFKVLKNLVLAADELEIQDIVIPFVDKSSINISKRKFETTISFLRDLCSETKNNKVRFCLETDLPPEKFMLMMEKINNRRMSINYDTGNSVSNGFDFVNEFNIYGDLVTNIHIKDRTLGGGSVNLGEGDMNFIEFFKYLNFRGYDGMFVMQAYREDNAINSLKPQLKYILDIISTYFHYEKVI